MRVRLSLLALAASLCLVNATMRPGFAEATGDTASQTRASAVLVSSHIGVHRDSIGAGVVVGVLRYGLRVVTARHVAAYEDPMLWIEGHSYPAEIVRTFAHRDLAVIDALVPAAVRALVVPARLAGVPTTDDRILIWGENDAGPRMERGRLVAPRYASFFDPLAPPLLGISCDGCAPGDSGAGIFASDGALLGILTARYHTSAGHTIAVVGERIDPSLFASGDETP